MWHRIDIRWRLAGFTNGLVPSETGVIIRDGGVVPVPAPPIPGMANQGGVAVEAAEPGIAVNQAFGPERDRLWTRSVVTWLLLSALFIFLSVQAISPTRRWHLRRGSRAPRTSRMSLTLRVPTALRPGRTFGSAGALVPPDPRDVLEGPLDPTLEAMPGSLMPHRRRLWLRRIVRRAWIALAGHRHERGRALDRGPVRATGSSPTDRRGHIGRRAARVAGRRDRGPPLAREAALAVDVEGGLGDRVSSALELAVAFPASATPPGEGVDLDAAVAAVDEAAETDRFVRRQRRDALRSLQTAPVCSSRASRNPAIAALAAFALLVPVVRSPTRRTRSSPSSSRSGRPRTGEADRLEEIAHDLETRGRDAEDPRTRLAEELRELARQLREKPGELAANLRQLGAVESDVRARIDPSTEQRASAMTSLARSLSGPRPATRMQIATVTPRRPGTTSTSSRTSSTT